MASTPGQVKEPTSSSGDALVFAAVGLVIVVTVVMWLAMLLAGDIDSNNPFTAPIMLVTGDAAWSSSATVWLLVMVVPVLALIVGGWLLFRRRGGSTTRVDTAQRHLATTKDLDSLSVKATASKARSLGVNEDAAPAGFSTLNGVPIGQSLTGAPLYGSWEDMHLDIWGPRQGKSTSRIIPAICEAPGAVLATENKRGNLDHTRLVREFRDANGVPTRKVWVFDPQGVANEEPWWYWNPLSYVRDETNAEELAQLFAAGDDGTDAKKDPYFEPEGEDLLANLILASALAGESITVVYERLVQRTRCHEAVAILNDHRYPMIAFALATRLNYADKQQDGIFGTAVKMAKCLRSRDIGPWVAAQGEDDDRPQLDLHAYVTKGETLYLLSKEGVGSAGPLAAALTMAATKVAERIATASPGGRLPVPMLCALDEAANVVRWPDLPKLYSHFGSRGIIMITVLQSWSQGIGVWGERHMKLLESSSNVYVFGGNVREAEYLRNLVQLTGEYERQAVNVSRQQSGGPSAGSGSVSRSVSKENIFTPAQLAAWPRGRALLFSAGNPPVIARTVPWMERPYAELIRRSLHEYSPQSGESQPLPEPPAPVDLIPETSALPPAVAGPIDEGVWR